MIGQGDYFQAQVNYTQGALQVHLPGNAGHLALSSGRQRCGRQVIDGVYGGMLGGRTATDVELTTAWNVNAAYEHFWNPRWRTSLYGGYAQVSYNGAANAMLCSAAFNGIGTGTGIGQGHWPLPVATTTGTPGGSARAPSGTSPRTSTWVSTSSTKSWNARAPRTGSLHAGNGSVRAGTVGPLRVDDQDNFQFRFRVHRDFYP